MTLFSRISLTQAGTRGNSSGHGKAGIQSASHCVNRHQLYHNTVAGSSEPVACFFSHTPSESSQSYLCWTEPPPRCNAGPGTGLPAWIQTFRTWKASGRAGRGRPDPHGCAGPSLHRTFPTPNRRMGRSRASFLPGLVAKLVAKARKRGPAGRRGVGPVASSGEAVGCWSCPMCPLRERSSK